MVLLALTLRVVLADHQHHQPVAPVGRVPLTAEQVDQPHLPLSRVAVAVVVAAGQAIWLDLALPGKVARAGSPVVVVAVEAVLTVLIPTIVAALVLPGWVSSIIGKPDDGPQPWCG